MSQKQAMVWSCSRCGRPCAGPVELKVQTKGAQTHYNACPYCFSPMGLIRLGDRRAGWTENPDDLKNRLSETLPNAGLEESSNVNEKVKPIACAHFIGYLKTRQKGSPILDQCLTCAKIVECM